MAECVCRDRIGDCWREPLCGHWLRVDLGWDMPDRCWRVAGFTIVREIMSQGAGSFSPSPGGWVQFVANCDDVIPGSDGWITPGPAER